MYSIERIVSKDYMNRIIGDSSLKFIYVFDNGRMIFFENEEPSEEEIAFERSLSSLFNEILLNENGVLIIYNRGNRKWNG